MVFIFYLFSFLSIFFSLLIMQSNNPIYSLIYLILLTCSIANIFFIIGSTFIGIIEIVLYAGAIMVLFVFVVMLIQTREYHKNILVNSLKKPFNVFSFFCSLSILSFLIVQFFIEKKKVLVFKTIGLKIVGLCLFSKYVFLVELISLLLLAATLLACLFLKK